MSDSAWHDDTAAFLEHGPITAMQVFHSGDGWRDPYIGFHPGGEFKGIQPSYGGVTNDQELLFGARKPHKMLNWTLEPGEKMVKVELQHSDVMRWMAFTTSAGRRFEWGFKDAPGAETFVIEPPREGAYLAAFRGYEGKQLPKELGGYKKRYIVQVGFVWAMPECGAGYEWEEPSAADPGALGGLFNGLFGGFGQRRTPPGARPPAPAFAPVTRLSVTPPPPMPPQEESQPVEGEAPKTTPATIVNKAGEPTAAAAPAAAAANAAPAATSVSMLRAAAPAPKAPLGGRR